MVHTLAWTLTIARPRRKSPTGKLLTLDNLIDTTTGTLKMRAIFNNNNGSCFPNQFVNTRLLVNTPAT